MESGERRVESQVVRVNRRRLLEFFDEKAEGSHGHATAVISVCGEDLGMGLMRHYFESQGSSVEAERLCTQGTPSGVRLDGWLHVTSLEDDTLYQVEIKNWSAHAIGGRPLRIDAPPEIVAKYRISSWAREWDDKQGLKQKPVIKVLTKMKRPARFPELAINPLVCYWTAMHPTGGEECLFSVALPHRTWCDRLWVFSMSSYLRSLHEEWLELHMPDTLRRLRWLQELIPDGHLTGVM